MQTVYTYPGVALHPDLEQGKAPGQITLDPRSIRFQYEDKEIEFSLQNLIVKGGGSSNQLVFLEHPDHPGWQIYTGKKVILKDLKRLSTPQVSSQVSNIHSSYMKFRLLIAAVLIAIVLVVAGLFQLKNPLTKAVARAVPAEWEESLGQSVFDSYTAGKIIIDDEETEAALQTMSGPLLDSIESERYNFRVYIVKDDTINAFALPGGFVVFNTGLLQTAESSEEVLGVLAHEIAHVTQQHGIRKIMEQVGLMLLINAFFGDLGGMWAQVIEGGRFLLNQQFSRDFEKDADIMGFTYLVDAGINPAGMTAFFQRLYEQESEEDSIGDENVKKALSILSTHPASDQRIKYLQKKIDKLDNKDDFLNQESDFKELRDSLKKALQDF